MVEIGRKRITIVNKILADDAAALVAINHKREPTEHSSFPGWAFFRQDVANSVSYTLIEGHRS